RRVEGEDLLQAVAGRQLEAQVGFHRGVEGALRRRAGGGLRQAPDIVLHGGRSPGLGGATLGKRSPAVDAPQSPAACRMRPASAAPASSQPVPIPKRNTATSAAAASAAAA